MSIKSNSSIEIKEWGDWRIAWANKKNLSQCREMLITKQIDGLGLSPHHGSNFKDLHDFVSIEGLHALVLPFCESIDLEHLGLMHQLRQIVVGGAKGRIDLSDLSFLEDATLDWSRELVLPKSPVKLRRLQLDKFKPISDGIIEISRFQKLNTLKLVQANIRTLDGIEQMLQLKNVELHYMANLTSIKHIADTSVEQLMLTHCKKLTDLHTVEGCRKLRILQYHDSAALPSIVFVNQCPKLEEFRFVGVDVRDGNMMPLTRLKDFAFTQKKHFSHTEKALKMLIQK